LEVLAKGAEADIVLGEMSIGCGPPLRVIVKRRIRKRYRNPALDTQIRAERTRREARLLHEAKKAGVNTPVVYLVNPSTFEIVMEHVEGCILKNVVETVSNSLLEEVCTWIGGDVAKLHTHNIVHGDLTTSNMLLHGNRLVFIDFGLGEVTPSIEAKGVDLHLLKKALHTTHREKAEIMLEHIFEAYQGLYSDADKVLTRVNQIESRGRYL